MVFLLLGGLLLGLGLRRGDSLPGFLLLSAGVAYLGLGAGYAGCWPGLLGKTRRGRLLLSSYAFFWPYHLCNYGSLAFFRLLMREAPFDEIVPGLYLGGRLLPWDK
ncbi:MAG TPA: hypothetical protein VNZ22_00100, partial [Bacillota bacterium]|nr:hypothetical protein [Bacillota bacterium]